MTVHRIADDPLNTIKRRPSIRDVKDSEVLWLVAEIDRLRTELERFHEKDRRGDKGRARAKPR